MVLRKIKLIGWRNHDNLEIPFPDNLVLLYGENGAGKTNIAEAIYYLSLARSWRCDDVKGLIKDGRHNAFIEAEISEGNLNRVIQMSISKGGKKIAINGKPIKKIGDLSKVVNMALFNPSDASIFTGSPSSRRNFLDVSISKVNQNYFLALGKFNRLLEERNAALKIEPTNMDLIEVLTERLISESCYISKVRFEYVARLNEALSSIIPKLFGEGRTAKIVYKPFVNVDEEMSNEALKSFKKALQSDLIRKNTSIGPHREDICMELNGKDIGVYGSSGENRLGAIALKISPFFLVSDDAKKPIVILDDVYSELDKEHSARLTDILKKMGQVFVTAPNISINEASKYEVSINKAIRRN